jgi:hypothetical protein
VITKHLRRQAQKTEREGKLVFKSPGGGEYERFEVGITKHPLNEVELSHSRGVCVIDQDMLYYKNLIARSPLPKPGDITGEGTSD